MNIKGLLLGSAAALVAVSGARAADAVVIAEPEPFEYVRICDTYGAGFYYIPGTETCLKFSGYMRYDIGIGARGHQNVFDKTDIGFYDDGYPDDYILDADRDDTYYKRARFQLRVDARQETELGTLRAYAAVNFQYSTSGTSVGSDGSWYDPSTDGYVVSYPYAFAGYTGAYDGVAIEHAYIELGGFRVGKTDSLFSTFTGYTSGVSNDGLVPYGPFGTHQIAYTFTGGNGFSAAVALEEGGIEDWGNYVLDSYMPHVVAGVGYTGGWGGVSGVVGYDSIDETWAGKVRVDFNVNDAISLFVMGGLKDDADIANYYGPWGGDWAVWVGGAWMFNEKATFNFEVGYDDAENLSVAANVDYKLVNNFSIIPEVTYQDAESWDDDLDGDQWGGFLRFQYNWGS